MIFTFVVLLFKNYIKQIEIIKTKSDIQKLPKYKIYILKK